MHQFSELHFPWAQLLCMLLSSGASSRTGLLMQSILIARPCFHRSLVSPEATLRRLAATIPKPVCQWGCKASSKPFVGATTPICATLQAFGHARSSSSDRHCAPRPRRCLDHCLEVQEVDSTPFLQKNPAQRAAAWLRPKSPLPRNLEAPSCRWSQSGLCFAHAATPDQRLA